MLCGELTSIVQPADTVVFNDFIIRSTLTFTRPLQNRILLLPELEAGSIPAAGRLVYLESDSVLSKRNELAARMAKFGFGTMQEVRIHAPDGKSLLPEWRFLVFQRR